MQTSPPNIVVDHCGAGKKARRVGTREKCKTRQHFQKWFSGIVKKSLAYQIIYRAMKKIQQKTETNPLSVLRQAIRGVTPDIAVKARRVGGSTHQVPVESFS